MSRINILVMVTICIWILLETLHSASETSVLLPQHERNCRACNTFSMLKSQDQNSYFTIPINRCERLKQAFSLLLNPPSTEWKNLKDSQQESRAASTPWQSGIKRITRVFFEGYRICESTHSWESRSFGSITPGKWLSGSQKTDGLIPS